MEVAESVYELPLSKLQTSSFGVPFNDAFYKSFFPLVKCLWMDVVLSA